MWKRRKEKWIICIFKWLSSEITNRIDFNGINSIPERAINELPPRGCCTTFLSTHFSLNVDSSYPVKWAWLDICSCSKTVYQPLSMKGLNHIMDSKIFQFEKLSKKINNNNENWEVKKKKIIKMNSARQAGPLDS